MNASARLVRSATAALVLQAKQISGDLNCSGSTPANANADFVGTVLPNLVSGREAGQCVGQ